ncbi:MAG: hypothetical protein F2789_11715 [Actinobacteria bacterium]|nr:hypothetical protein [Actinomycetota bacterium]
MKAPELPTIDQWPAMGPDDLIGENTRLLQDLAAANARACAARERLARKEADLRAVLRNELVASKDAIAAMERQHEVNIAMVRKAAQIEVGRIMTAAREAVAQRAAGDVPDEPGRLNDVG